MVEDHLPLLPDHVAGDVVLRCGNPLHQAMKQRHVQGLGQLGTGYRAGQAGLQTGMDIHLLMYFLHRPDRKAAFEERFKVDHLRG